VIPAYAELDLDNDFTVELWLRLSPDVAENGEVKCVFSVVRTEGEDQQATLPPMVPESLPSSSAVPLSLVHPPLTSSMVRPNVLRRTRFTNGVDDLAIQSRPLLWADRDEQDEDEDDDNDGDDNAAAFVHSRSVEPRSHRSLVAPADNLRLFLPRIADATRHDLRADTGRLLSAPRQSSDFTSSASTTTARRTNTSGGAGGSRLNNLHAYLSQLSAAVGGSATGLLVPPLPGPWGPISFLGGASAIPLRTITDTNVSLGARVIRREHWHYGNQDGHGVGIVVGFVRTDQTRAVPTDDHVPDNPLLPGWARVR